MTVFGRALAEGVDRPVEQSAAFGVAPSASDATLTEPGKARSTSGRHAEEAAGSRSAPGSASVFGGGDLGQRPFPVGGRRHAPASVASPRDGSVRLPPCSAVGVDGSLRLGGHPGRPSFIPGGAGRGVAWLGLARRGLAGIGAARLGRARHGDAWLGMAGLGAARRGEARLGGARPGAALQGAAMQGAAMQGTERRGLSVHGKASHGMAWPGASWTGPAWQGPDRLGKPRQKGRCEHPSRIRTAPTN